MAIYVDAVRKTGDPLEPTITVGSDKVQVDFSVDNQADISSLPGLDKIRGGSSAFILSTKQVVFLGENGWM